MFKNVWNVALVAALFFMVSCDKSNEESGPGFIDQPLQGEVDGAAWAATHGYFEVDADNNEMNINLFDANGGSVDNVCELFFSDFTELFFYLPLETGTYELNLDFEDLENSHTATFYVSEGSMNYIATEGTIEITEITDTQINGRMGIKLDNETFANGNFTVDICQ